MQLIGPAFDLVDRRLWRGYAHAFANSNVTKARLEAARLAPSGPLEVLHPGVDIERFNAGAARREPVLLVAGRIMWQKRIGLAIAAQRLAEQLGGAGELVVAGTVDAKSRPYLEQLRREASGLRVRFETDVDDERIGQLYRSATALVFTSPNEDFGIVPLEAMASGTPVIAVDGGGVRETVIHGRTGWLVPPEPAAFARVFVDVLANGDALSPMRAAARTRALEFGWEPFVKRVDAVMEAVVSRGASQAPS
jgi:glycosyltransferase involved in cell wall biosynthesis